MENTNCFRAILVLGTFMFATNLWANCPLANCSSIQNYREQQMVKETLAQNQKCVEGKSSQYTSPFLASIFGAVDAISANNKGDTFSSCINNVVNDVQKRRDSDREKIISKLKELGLDKLSASEVVKRLNRVISDEGSIYSYYKTRKGNWDIPFSHYVYTGPALELRTSLLGGVESDGVYKEVFKEPGLDVLKKQAQPVEYLIDKLNKEKRTVGPEPREENFLPGMAKIALFELMRDHYIQNGKIDQFNNFAKTMKLGLKVPESEFENQKAGDYFKYTVHDGYFLNAKKRHMEKDASQMSFDCTSLIQYCSFGIDSFAEGDADPEDKGLKIISSDFLVAISGEAPKDERQNKAVKQIKKSFSIQKVDCESDIKKGDIIAFKGHVLIFKGYERLANGQMKMKTIEASGNENRSLGEFEREIYLPGCSKMTWNRSGTLSDAYIVRHK